MEDTGIVLQGHQDSVYPTEKRLKYWVDHM
jgi:hypothetical protein